MRVGILSLGIPTYDTVIDIVQMFTFGMIDDFRYTCSKTTNLNTAPLRTTPAPFRITQHLSAPQRITQHGSAPLRTTPHHSALHHSALLNPYSAPLSKLRITPPLLNTTSNRVIT